MRGLFVTGTDTGVGKTYVVCQIAQEFLRRKLSLGLYKPTCSGAETTPQGQYVWDDVERLYTALQGQYSRERICPQCFQAPLAPPLAAMQEQREIDLNLCHAGLAAWDSLVEHVIVEGAGGWLCPLTRTMSFADWVTEWQLPVLIVARRGLGTINHTLLTIESIQRRNLNCVGVILNQADADDDDFSAPQNGHEITARSGVPVLGEFRWAAEGCLLHESWVSTVHWARLMSVLRPPRSSP